ncbi:hypothetical protein NKH77_06345 [Streptomyces sp. M19]
MAVRLPGAENLSAFWDMVRSGGRGIEYFDAADGLVGRAASCRDRSPSTRATSGSADARRG